MSHTCDLPIAAQIRDIASLTSVSLADGKISFSEACNVGAEILHAASHVVATIADPVAKLPEIVEAAESVYDEFIAPLDIVGVPNTIEPFVDGWIRGQIRPGITALVGSFGG